jgi:3-hydroxy acid dehydrogenase/malonic semialdehyde reductase
MYSSRVPILALLPPSHTVLGKKTHISSSPPESNIKSLSQDTQSQVGADSIKIFTTAIDVSSHAEVTNAISNVVKQSGPIDILLNNAALALGAPAAFPDLQIEVVTMTGTNVNRDLFGTHAALNKGGIQERRKGKLLNVTSTTALEVLPFPGESIYQASKTLPRLLHQDSHQNWLGTNIKVLALRPDVVANHSYEQRVGFDKNAYNGFHGRYVRVKIGEYTHYWPC